ncbi:MULTISPECIES: type II toxin-antitoxin system HicA family toxin [Gordonibacter]|uniref:Addiction module toxin, HicA family n=1 Tax=Gordonibacter urolithinfaciens TaxID=1335613 RepID=A0A423UJ76_9ACTN|nr:MULTISPECIES: type II toxin-antitoxin system HicA family toxin [Gordonibacter]MDN4507928.1 type II toxin-antitoxin system HicA family toxin [Gordonibacter sp. RACS_AR49]ROT89021.1 addiction module toxin, HicA family [Gordonibacter urolithinfaciens]ROT89352.1 addiction module toxin, HicA family [Gordonibacter urolithinfaciens]
MVKRRDLVKEVEAQGLRSTGGTNHETFKKPGFQTSIPRHREIDEDTARDIRKQAGIEKRR